MRIEIRRWEDVIVLTLIGELDTFDLETFSARIDTLIESGRVNLCFNLRLLTFLNSAALGYLIRTRKQVAGRGGKLVLVQPSRFVARTLLTLGLNELFPIFDSDVEALRFFHAGADDATIDLETRAVAVEELIGTGAILFRPIDDSPEEVPATASVLAVGRILVLREDGPVFSWRIPSAGTEAAEGGITLENFDRRIHEGRRLRIKTRQPLAVKSHFFESEVRVTEVTREVEEDGSEVAEIHAVYTTRGPDDRFSLPQGAPLHPDGPTDSAETRPERPS